jgi:DNA polymerase I-like protein with 3'-5' exonuclease and polymerase domains
MIYLVSLQQRIHSDEITLISVEESLKLLSSLTVVGLDTETRGMDPYTKELLSVQLGCNDFQVVIDCSSIDIKFYKEYLESDRLFIGWNLKFDLKFLFHKNIYPKKVYDGYLAEKLMWLGYPAGMHSMSLKSAGVQYLDIELDKSVRGKIQWAGLTDDVIIYAAYDVKYLDDIRLKQLDLLKEKDLLRAIDCENQFILPLSYCEYCGVRLDVDKWKVKMHKDEERVSKALVKLNEWFLKNEPNSSYIVVDRQGDLFSGFDLTPKVTINWNSAKQLIPIFKKYGIDVTVEDRDKGGTKDSIDAKQLGPQKDKCDLIPIYLDYKEAVKVTSTYGKNFLDQINVDGRIHTNYNQLGADTTRITSGGKDKSNNIDYVNLLNLPADAETRACFVAEEGNKWISIDYSG